MLEESADGEAQRSFLTAAGARIAEHSENLHVARMLLKLAQERPHGTPTFLHYHYMTHSVRDTTGAVCITPDGRQLLSEPDQPLRSRSVLGLMKEPCRDDLNYRKLIKDTGVRVSFGNERFRIIRPESLYSDVPEQRAMITSANGREVTYEENLAIAVELIQLRRHSLLSPPAGALLDEYCAHSVQHHGGALWIDHAFNVHNVDFFTPIESTCKMVIGLQAITRAQ